MKKMIWMISLLCMAATTGCMQDDPTYFQKPDWWVDGEQDEEGDGEYRLVWSEEFDEEPASGAEYAQPGEKWRFETGGSGWGNNEEWDKEAVVFLHVILSQGIGDGIILHHLLILLRSNLHLQIGRASCRERV